MKTQRNWGWYEVLAEGTGYKILKLFVKPYKRTPLAFHMKHKEIWVFLYGEVKEIEAYVKHQFVNHSNKGVRFIEIQIGERIRYKKKEIIDG